MAKTPGLKPRQKVKAMAGTDKVGEFTRNGVLYGYLLKAMPHDIYQLTAMAGSFYKKAQITRELTDDNEAFERGIINLFSQHFGK